MTDITVTIRVSNLGDAIIDAKTSEDIINTGVFGHLGKDIVDELVNSFSLNELYRLASNLEGVSFWNLMQIDMFRSVGRSLNAQIDDFLAKYLPLDEDMQYTVYTGDYTSKQTKLSRKVIEDAISTMFDYFNKTVGIINGYDFNIDFCSKFYWIGPRLDRKKQVYPSIRADGTEIVQVRGDGIICNE